MIYTGVDLTWCGGGCKVFASLSFCVCCFISLPLLLCCASAVIEGETRRDCVTFMSLATQVNITTPLQLENVCVSFAISASCVCVGLCAGICVCLYMCVSKYRQ